MPLLNLGGKSKERHIPHTEVCFSLYRKRADPHGLTSVLDGNICEFWKFFSQKSNTWDYPLANPLCLYCTDTLGTFFSLVQPLLHGHHLLMGTWSRASPNTTQPKTLISSS